MLIHRMKMYWEDEIESMPIRPLPFAFGFVLFVVLALLLGGMGVLIVAAFGFQPNWWLCALAVAALEVLLFYVAFGNGGKFRKRVSRK